MGEQSKLEDHIALCSNLGFMKFHEKCTRMCFTIYKELSDIYQLIDCQTMLDSIIIPNLQIKRQRGKEKIIES